MTSDFSNIFYWWFLLFGLGIIFLPLTKLFFKNFFDFGYAFSKIIAILLVCYLVWLVGSLHLLPFTLPTLLFIIFCLVILNFYLTRKFKKEFFNDFKKAWKILIFEELLFFFALFFWSYVRGFQPDIEGLEKFMDFGFVNSILRSRYFPPADMWMAGKTINYYYFGHLVAAVLTKLSNLSSTVTYNLMIATIFAFTFTGAFSLVANLISHWKLKIFGGLLSALLLTLGGNLHAFWWFLTHNLSFTGYWYPDATRFIVEKFGALDNTIHEFPIYSFVVSDLHGHVSNIPFVLLFLTLLFAWLSSHQDKTLITNYQLLITSLLLAVMYMTNSWDFPIYFLVFAMVAAYSYYSKYRFSQKSIFSIGLPARRSLGAGGLVVLVFIGSILFSLPFHLHFSQIAQGLDFVHSRSPFWQLLVLWGYQWVIMVSFLIFLAVKRLRIADYLAKTNPALKDQLSGEARSRSAGLIPDIYILILLAVATLLIVIPEIFYVKDIYITSYHRANTMFKLVYQSFMLYALSAGYIIVRLISNISKACHFVIKYQKSKILNSYSVFLIFTFLFLIFVMVYPYFAVNSYYGNLKNYQGLDGLTYLGKNYPDDYAGILWLNKNIKQQPVVLEAVGDSYTDFNRVSAFTGLPTIQGWLVHEWLWRGSFDEPGRRAAETDTIYQSPDQNLTVSLLEKYKVEYIFIGSKEREKYQVFEEKFKTLGKLVFQQGSTKIYSFEREDN